MRKLCRVLFSRYAVSFLIIAIDVALFTCLMVYLSSFQPAVAVALFIFDVLMLLHLINRDTSPENKLPWAVILLAVPFLGALLYALFFSRKLSRRERRHMASIGAFLPSTEERTRELSALATVDDGAAGKALAILAEDPQATVFRDTHATYLDDGAAFFEAMLRDVRAAQRYIFLETFILEDGAMWQPLHEALRERVACGVEVRLLYDDIGCMKTLPHDYDRRLREEGIDARRFAPVTPRVTVAHNNRDHRKILVVDGRIAYTGGVNIADEYIHRRVRFGHWKDGGVRLEGAAAFGLARLFLTSFDLTALTLTDPAHYAPTERGADGDGGFYIPFGSGPVPLYTAPVGKNALLSIIAQAKRYVYVTTPYLIMDHELTCAFMNAAKRGVDVRILTPHKPDKRLVFLLTRSAYPSLLSAGVRILEYTPGFLHEKLLVSDDLYAVIGTVNLDYRSFAHHFEDAVWMYRSAETARIRDGFLDTQSRSQEITLAEARLGPFARLARSFIRLFSPLL